MQPEIESYKIITVYGYCGNNVNSFTFPIEIEFVPNEVVLKYFNLYDYDSEHAGGLYFINTDLIYNKPLVSYPGCTAMNELFNTPFILNTPVNRIYTFTINSLYVANVANINILSTPSNIATFSTEVSFVLMFIKYKNHETQIQRF